MYRNNEFIKLAAAAIVFEKSKLFSKYDLFPLSLVALVGLSIASLIKRENERIKDFRLPGGPKRRPDYSNYFDTINQGITPMIHEWIL